MTARRHNATSRALVLGALQALLPSVAAAAPADEAQRCAALVDDSARLACYDRAFGRAPPLAVPPAAAGSVAVAAVPLLPLPPASPSEAQQVQLRRQHLGATLGERWEIDPGTSKGRFLPRAYKPVYLLPFVRTDRANRLPASPAQEHSLHEPLVLENNEAKYQISLKAKVWEGVFGPYGNLWAGYTQTSRWQVYNADDSRPFRETNYEPELMLVFGTQYEVLGWRGRVLGVSLNHQSNGRALPLSRSWNRLIAEADFEREGWTLTLRPWWRLPESAADDDNPDLADHLGRGELLLTRRMQRHVFTLQARHSLRGGSRSHGSLMIDWAFPLTDALHGYLQVFSGYGESMIDYNWRQQRIGLGVSVVQWQ